jgi:3-hydroxy-9,10-secoandrosta-1,3,5(10)-triene-9,17-dione monooxygenase reductase component
MSEPTPKAPLDARAFRAALGAFVTGVTIITTADAAGRPAGLTANSFNSVSLDPPLVLFSLGLDSTSLDAFRQAKFWAVHVLSAGQEALSNKFAKKEGNKFLDVTYAEGPGGIPLLDGFAARFVCRAAFEYEGGDHAIFLGEVMEFDQAGLPPLIYHQGRYGGVFPAAASAAEAEAGFDDLAQRGLAVIEGGKALLTPEGQQVARGLSALVGQDDRFSLHERTALKHLLSRLTS